MISAILDNGPSHLSPPLRMSPLFPIFKRQWSGPNLADAQLPTLWFAVLMAGHVLDHTLLGATRLAPRTRLIWFMVWTTAVVVNFWWFKDFALGIYGPVNDHKGWLWRGSWNVSPEPSPPGRGGA